MKIKNYYMFCFIAWAITTLIDTLACVIFFTQDNIVATFIFLVLSVAFAFVTGILFVRATIIYNYNKDLKKLEFFTKELKEMEKNEPFGEFDVPFPEVKEKRNEND